MPMDGLPPPRHDRSGRLPVPGRARRASPSRRSMVDEHYFDTIGLPILKGRGFRATDSADAPKVAVVNELLARALLARAGSDRQAFSSGRQQRTVGGDRRPREDQQIQLHHRSGLASLSISRTGSVRSESMFLLVDRRAIRRVSSTPLREVVRALDAEPADLQRPHAWRSSIGCASWSSSI